MIAPDIGARLLNMLELNATFFLETVTELKRLNTVLDTRRDQFNDNEQVDAQLRGLLSESNQRLIDAILAIGARSAWVSANRLQNALNDPDAYLTIAQLRATLIDIELRFKDEAEFIKLFVISAEKSVLFGGAQQLLGEVTASKFRSAWFDCEEAAKCLCLGRPTACVFHCMRMLEIGIKSFAKRLNVEDPLDGQNRNWGKILGKIKEELDKGYPMKTRRHGTLGSIFEAIYANLESIRNPWRNSTMHVEATYTEQEAQHILSCTATLLSRMAEVFDEEGAEVDTSNLSIAPPKNSRDC